MILFQLIVSISNKVPGKKPRQTEFVRFCVYSFFSFLMCIVCRSSECYYHPPHFISHALFIILLPFTYCNLPIFFKAYTVLALPGFSMLAWFISSSIPIHMVLMPP